MSPRVVKLQVMLIVGPQMTSTTIFPQVFDHTKTRNCFDLSTRHREDRGPTESVIRTCSSSNDSMHSSGFIRLSQKQYYRIAVGDRIDQVAFCFTKQVATYAIGRSLTYNEIETVKRKCVKLKAQNYRLQDILLTVVNSSFFLEKWGIPVCGS